MTADDFRIRRINEGLSRRGLARELGIPEQTLRRFESGLGVSLPNAKKIADHFGVQVTDLEPFKDEVAV